MYKIYSNTYKDRLLTLVQTLVMSATTAVNTRITQSVSVEME